MNFKLYLLIVTGLKKISSNLESWFWRIPQFLIKFLWSTHPLWTVITEHERHLWRVCVYLKRIKPKKSHENSVRLDGFIQFLHYTCFFYFSEYVNQCVSQLLFSILSFFLFYRKNVLVLSKLRPFSKGNSCVSFQLIEIWTKMSSKNETACVYASLILIDDDVAVTVSILIFLFFSVNYAVMKRR